MGIFLERYFTDKVENHIVICIGTYLAAYKNLGHKFMNEIKVWCKFWIGFHSLPLRFTPYNLKSAIRMNPDRIFNLTQSKTL